MIKMHVVNNEHKIYIDHKSSSNSITFKVSLPETNNRTAHYIFEMVGVVLVNSLQRTVLGRAMYILRVDKLRVLHNILFIAHVLAGYGVTLEATDSWV